jgi:hypothetical protein
VKRICALMAGRAALGVVEGSGVSVALAGEPPAAVGLGVVTVTPDAFAVVEELLVALMLNSPDWAYMLLRLDGSWTRLTRNLSPVGHPALGGLTVVVPFEPSIRAARTWLLIGITERSSFVRTAVKFWGSVLTRSQLSVWAPELVQSWDSEGTVTLYANADAEKARRRAAKLNIVVRD